MGKGPEISRWEDINLTRNLHYLSFLYDIIFEYVTSLDCYGENHSPQMVSFVLKPMIATLDLTPDLIAILSFTRNVIFINK